MISSPPLKTISRLILASASPRRKALLGDIGLDFKVIEANVEEVPYVGETPQEFALRAACDKAGAVSRNNVASWVLGADTVVVYEGRILGKPTDAEEALEMLQALAGHSHLVHTGFCLAHADNQVFVRRVVTTEVTFSPFSGDIAAAYVATKEPLDKAGAYGIQGCGAFLVEKINGSYTNVVGLPLAEVIQEFLRQGIIVPGKG